MNSIQYAIYALIIALMIIVSSSFFESAYAIQYVAEGVNPKTKEHVLAEATDSDVKGEYNVIVFDRLLKIHVIGKMTGKGIITCIGHDGTKYKLNIVGTTKE